MSGRDIREMSFYGFCVHLDVELGHLWVEHDGTITWDQLQAIKCCVWGNDAAAIEVYPPQSQIVNSRNTRHLWRLGQGEFFPDLLGDRPQRDTLRSRYERAWEGV